MNAAENIIYAVFTSGAFFGEFALLFSQRRTATIKANTYCDLFTLSQDDFLSVLSDFPEFESLIKREGLRPVVSKFKIYADICSIGEPSATDAKSSDHTPLLDLFVSKLKPRMVAEGRVIFRQGMDTEEDGGISFISKGTVILEDENEYKMFTVVEGYHFGHYSVIRNGRRSLIAKAVTECQLFTLSAQAYESIYHQFPVFADMLEDVCEEGAYFD
jgi:CRP-like cAMP-binding protein